MKKNRGIIFILIIATLVIHSCSLGGSTIGESTTPTNPTSPYTPSVPSEPTEYKIKYHNNNGSGEIKTDVVAKGSSYSLPANNFNNPGYGFLGWSIEENSTTVTYVDQDTITMGSEVINLYAIWALGDTLDPRVLDFQMVTGDIDVTNSAQTVTFKVWANDDFKLSKAKILLLGPTGSSKSGTCNVTDSSYTGTDTAGVFTIDITIPQNDPSGIWKLWLMHIYDEEGNSIPTSASDSSVVSKGWNYTFENTGIGDNEDPVVTNVSMSTPSVINTSDSAQQAQFEIYATDDLKLFRASIWFKSSTDETKTFTINTSDLLNYEGDEKNGKFKINFPLPQGSPATIWRLENIILYDSKSRVSVYNSTTLTAKGWDYQFTITN